MATNAISSTSRLIDKDHKRQDKTQAFVLAKNGHAKGQTFNCLYRLIVLCKGDEKACLEIDPKLCAVRGKSLWRFCGYERSAIRDPIEAKERHDKTVAKHHACWCAQRTMEEIAAALERSKQTSAAVRRVHRPIHLNSKLETPSWANRNHRQKFDWRFTDHLVVISQRPEGRKGPVRDSELCSIAVPNDPQTEDEHKDRERLVADLRESAAGDKYPDFRVAICGRKVTYEGRNAQMYILVGNDVDVAFVEKDLREIVRLYNKSREWCNLTLVEE